MVSDICLKNANDKRDSSMYVYVKRLFMLLAAQLCEQLLHYLLSLSPRQLWIAVVVSSWRSHQCSSKDIN